MIICLQTLRISILIDKQRYNTSQDQNVFGQNFETFCTVSITGKTLFTLCLYISTTRYLENRALYFTDVTDTKVNLDFRLVQEVVEDNCNQIVVIEFKKELAKKKNEQALNNKAHIETFCHLIILCARSSKLPYTGSLTFLLPHLVPASAVSYPRSLRLPRAKFFTLLLHAVLPAPTLLLPYIILALAFLLSYIISAPALLLPYIMPTPAFQLPCAMPALVLLLPQLVPASTLLLLCPVSSDVRIFKQFFSDESWPYILFRSVHLLHLFPTLGPYNLTNNNKYKRTFDITFINSYLFASNYP